MRRDMRLGGFSGGKKFQRKRSLPFKKKKRNSGKFFRRKMANRFHDQTTIADNQTMSANSLRTNRNELTTCVMNERSISTPKHNNNSASSSFIVIDDCEPTVSPLISVETNVSTSSVVDSTQQGFRRSLGATPNTSFKRSNGRRVIKKAQRFSKRLRGKAAMMNNPSIFHSTPKCADSPNPSAQESSTGQEIFKNDDTEPHDHEPELNSQSESVVLLDDLSLNLSSLDPNALIVIDETVCTNGRPSVISVDSDSEINCEEEHQKVSTSEVPVISVESDEENVINISDDDDEVVPVSWRALKRKLPSFIPISKGAATNNEKNWKRKKVVKDPPNETEEPKPKPLGLLRPIVIDGSNVAFSHGLRTSFSAKGIKIIADYFKNRSHRVHVFIPQFRRFHPQTKDGQLLDELESVGDLHYTPSRRVEGKLICSYDDRFIVEFAAQKKAIIVTRDNFRDLMDESKDKPEWKDTISKRLLQYTFVEDLVLFPDDPLGRGGPRLEEFLRFPVGETPP